MYKLIALDLDGTLLDKNKNITSDNILFINEIIEKGYEVVIATGRRYYSAKQLTQSINKHMTIMANNGNIIRNSLDDKIIFSRFMDRMDIKDVLIAGKLKNLHPIIHVDYFYDGYDMVIESDICESNYCNYLPKDETRFKTISTDLIYDIDRVLALVYPGKIAILKEFYKELNHKYPNRYNSHVLEHIDIAEGMFEVMNPLGSKWKSLLEYSSSIRIKPEEIIAVGDDNNDAEMILNAGLGIAMKNGSDLVKDAAKIITERDNNNSGVSFELRRILDI